jgi:hypothetical protein
MQNKVLFIFYVAFSYRQRAGSEVANSARQAGAYHQLGTTGLLAG